MSYTEKILFANNAASTLASGISAGALSLSVQPGAGALFPNPGASEAFTATLVDSSLNVEIIKVTGRAVDTFTIVRAQEGTAARAYVAGDKVELRLTKETLEQMPQTQKANTFTAANTFQSTTTHTGAMTNDGSTRINGDLNLDGSTGNAGQVPCKHSANAKLAYWAPRGWIGGLTLSNNGSDANNDIDISAGEATDDTNSYVMKLSSSITKRLDAAWAVGTNQGGLDTGAEANDTWYHLWLIMRPDTGVVDVLFSASATAPTMPANYTVKRRLGAVRNNGSGNILAFHQYGDEFYLDTPLLDVNANNPGTSAVSRTLTVPSGVKVKAMMDTTISIGGISTYVYLSSLDSVDMAASLTAAPLSNLSETTGSGTGSGYMEVMTNTSSQIRSRLNASDASTTLRLATLGWKDRRGRFD